jgi:hypothetical protein
LVLRPYHLALITAAAIVACKPEAPKEVPIAGLATFTGLSQDHVDGTVKYPQTPPVGGAHSLKWQNCGIYDAPIKNEFGVHSMEHGAAWVTYRPDLSSADVEKLRTLVKSWPFIVLSPYPDLPAPVFATAWGLQIRADSVSDPRLSAFLSKYVLGPQTPEPGAPCSGSEGKPIG